MSNENENNNQESKQPLRLSKPGKLELRKTVDAGQVKQSFSHGRSKTVVVEKRTKRTFERGTSGKMAAVPNQELAEGLANLKKSTAAGEGSEPSPTPRASAQPAPSSNANDNLTASERVKRMAVLEQAKAREAERAAHAAEEAQRRDAERKAREASERARQEELRQLAEADEARRMSERQAEEAKNKPAQPSRAEKPAASAPVQAAPTAQAPAPAAERPRTKKGEVPPRVQHGPEEAPVFGRVKKAKGQEEQNKKTTLRAKNDSGRRRSSKLSVADALEGDEDRMRSLSSIRRQREREKQRAKEALATQQKIVREVIVPETITVGELANRMAERSGDVIRVLMKMGVMATVNQSIDADTAELVVEELGHEIRRVAASDVLEGLTSPVDDEGAKTPRPPVVTVMGHVDHGKTSILDFYRKANVVSGEAGGITQHIGAYQIAAPSGKVITFLDTPGHAAFTEMRARGANVTDMVILVVAADDGIMPQTQEAIAHAKAAGVPMIVAVNKCDKPDADPLKVEQALLQYEVQVESMGGEVQVAHVSALQGTGMDSLLEAVELQSEVLDLSANANSRASGAVVESKMEKGRGSVATVLIQRGTLEIGDIFVAGAEWGKVRALINDQGKQVKQAMPSTPIEVLGLNGTPVAGDEFVVVESESRAREVAEFRQSKAKEAASLASKGSLESMFSALKDGTAEELPVVIKGDVHGSVEAIIGTLQKLSTEEVKVSVLHQGVGGITESDITLARASNAMVVGFNVRANAQARESAKRDGIDIRYYSIIYELVDDVKALMSGLLKPEQRESFLGYATILETFNVTKVGRVAGCRITEGVVKRGAKVRLLRDDTVIHEGTLKTLRRFKDEVREVGNGLECGMAFENYQDVQVGDQIECFEIEEIARQL
ncbi:MAG: translation initiation factor IF-2 [Alphaproteobacteria bacterium TMED89]|nr:translation initiation factor IF-2 [Rhodospirillaceae bacterium]RPH15032.1 MAG: translation initiation factor IF-2 [Alphaproteobacteria bacterium TMED89]